MERLLNKHFILCWFMQLLFMASFNMTSTIIASYVVSLESSTVVAGVITGAMSFFALLFRPFAGFAADRVWRKALLGIGVALTAASFAGYALATTAPLVMLFRTTHAMGLCIQTTVNTVIAMEFMPEENVGEGVGYIALANTFGLAFGPLVGILLSERASFEVVFVGASLVMVVVLLLLFLLPVPRSEKKKEGPASFRDFVSFEALPLSVTALSFAFCVGMTSSFMVLLCDARGIAGVAAFFAVSSSGMSVLRPLVGRRVDKKGLQSVMPVAFAAECLTMMTAAFAQSFLWILFSAVFRIFGQGIAQPSLQGHILRDAGDSERGVASSTFYMGIDIGQGLGAMIGGVLASTAGYTAAFLAGPILLAVGFSTYLFWARGFKVRNRMK